MARARDIKPTFFTDGKLRRLPLAARLLFEALWCLADREGRLKDDPDDIEVFVGDLGGMAVDDALAALHPKFITRYEAGGRNYIQVNHFARHQHPHPKEVASTIPAPDSIDPELAVGSNGKPCNYTASNGITRQAATFPAGPSEPSMPSEPSGPSGSSRSNGSSGGSNAREEPNAFAATEPPTPTVESYIADELPRMSPGNIDQLRSLQDDGMQDDAIKMAVDIAAARNSRTWGFVYGILRKWAEAGVWTAGDAKAAEDAFRAQKARAAPGRPSQPALSKAEQFMELARRYESEQG